MALKLPHIGREMIGLDIGSSAVKVAIVRRKSGRFTVTRLAENVIDDGDQPGPDNREKTATAIWRCLTALQATDNDVVCGLSGPEVTVRTFSLPGLRRAEIAAAVRLEAVQVCPFNIDDSMVDYQLLSAGPTADAVFRPKKKDVVNTTGILAAATKSAIKRNLQLTEMGHGKCALMDVDGLALLNCIVACNAKHKGKTVLVLNVGSSYTNLAILPDSMLPLVRDIQYAGSAIIAQVCTDTGLTNEAVAKALAEPAGQSKSDQNIRDSFKKACAKLANDVMDTIRYYTTQQQNNPIEEIYLCGGFAQTAGLIDVLTSLLPGSIRLWDPLAALPCSRAVRKSSHAKSGPAFAVALGLAMRYL